MELNSKTHRHYCSIAVPYFLKYEEEYEERPFDDLPFFKKFLKKQIDYKYEITTLRVIRVAIRRVLSTHGVDTDLPDFIPVEKGSGSSRAKRRKSCPIEAANAMREFVFMAGKRYESKARLAVMIMYSSIYFGLRPAEWFTANFDSEYSELVVINAKFSEELGRSFGPKRTLIVQDDMPRHVLDGARWVVSEIGRLGLNVDHPSHVKKALMESLANGLRRVHDAALKSNSMSKSKNGHRYTMYSGRHQFAANAKKAGLSKFEIAALMGHASIETAGNHYGKKRHGNSGVHVMPHDDDAFAVKKLLQKKENIVIPDFIFP